MDRFTTISYLSGPETLRRRELVWGVLREPPAPLYGHQRAVTDLAYLLQEHTRVRAQGQVCVSPIDVVLDARSRGGPGLRTTLITFEGAESGEVPNGPVFTSRQFRKPIAAGGVRYRGYWIGLIWKSHGDDYARHDTAGLILDRS